MSVTGAAEASDDHSSSQIDLMLADDVSRFYADPLGFVMYAFDWGHDQLRGFDGADAWQRDVMCDISKMVRDRKFDGITPVEPIKMATASGHGIGKGHPVTMDYYGKQWGDLEPGDTVFNDKGELTTILRTNNYKREHFLVMFDDGSSVIVSGQHEWNVRGRQERRKGLDTWRTLETQQIIDLGVKRPNGVTLARQWEIPVQGAVSYPVCDVTVDAYTYGVWLGDGDKRSGRITNIDEEVWQNVDYAWNTDIQGITKTLIGLKRDLIDNNLFGCTTYTASVDRRYVESDQRLAVLQGLLDTDGWVEQSGGAAFCSASRQLVVDVIKIARSLGLRVREESFKDNDCAGAWQTHITWDGVTQLFRIKRKQDNLVHADHRYQCRWIESINSVGVKDGMCIEVEGGLYLTPDYHVTHNSALTAWLILWIMSTRPLSKGVVTANTGDQLRTKTWSELSKWKNRCITGHWFELNAMSMHHKSHPDTWRVDAQTSREENSESFAGLHCADSTPWYIFDEASAIPDKIWEVAEGGLTDGEPHFYCFGNPTRNSGKFYECFGRQKHRWMTRQIDSRTAKMTNKLLIQQWCDDYGEDSDFVRVRVRGRFPRAGDQQFIPSDDVHAAQKRGSGQYLGDDPLICGIDIARGGDDNCMIGFRRGKDAKSEKTYRIPGEKSRDSMRVVSMIVMILDRHKPDVTFLDETGIGGPILDRLVQLGYHVIGVGFGDSAIDSKHFYNRTAEMGFKCREWLANGGAIPDDPQLEIELTTREYWHNAKDQLVLESKGATKNGDGMKKRLGISPDWADQLYLTFAHEVPKRELPRGHLDSALGVRQQNHADYDPLENM